MKANILVIDSSRMTPTERVERLCNRLMPECYSYLICPGCGFREDNAHGVRFLSHELASPPRLGEVAAIVSFAGPGEIAGLVALYPGRPVFHVRPGAPAPRVSAILAAVRRSTENERPLAA
ncbi:hypothetical protein [Luteolibacter marinus]|uniref:hypothetical protein n=1 Tax=Luteolibacter marinus TaxID=2776705 RepID=UPI00186798D6|nr:hypothetical protein [Luteolibacter marinus]